MLRIEDERGVKWIVSAGDPANILVNKLKAKGFEYIILPWNVLYSGEGGFKFLPDDVVRKARLHDCLLALMQE